jgi:hypothetical protein
MNEFKHLMIGEFEYDQVRGKSKGFGGELAENL